jgi:hypothetical protein
MGQVNSYPTAILCTCCDFLVRKSPAKQTASREALRGRRFLYVWLNRLPVRAPVLRVLVLNRMIHMVIVFVPLNFTAHVILLPIHLCPLLAGQVTPVRRAIVVHLLIDASFLPFDMPGFVRRQLAGSHAVRDPFLLMRLPLTDSAHRRRSRSPMIL